MTPDEPEKKWRELWVLGYDVNGSAGYRESRPPKTASKLWECFIEHAALVEVEARVAEMQAMFDEVTKAPIWEVKYQLAAANKRIAELEAFTELKNHNYAKASQERDAARADLLNAKIEINNLTNALNQTDDPQLTDQLKEENQRLRELIQRATYMGSFTFDDTTKFVAECDEALKTTEGE